MNVNVSVKMNVDNVIWNLHNATKALLHEYINEGRSLMVCMCVLTEDLVASAL